MISDNTSHAHITFAIIERSSVDGCYIIKPLKQKQFVHGLCYLLQEIYGIENKNSENTKVISNILVSSLISIQFACRIPIISLNLQAEKVYILVTDTVKPV